jgi:hypothetical protein
MDFLIILAQAAESTREAAAGATGSAGTATAGAAPEQVSQSLVPLNLIWQHITSLGLLEAIMFISFGALWLFYGWKIFKMLVVICFGIIGLILGVLANKYLVGGDVTWLALLFIILFAVISIPIMKWGVCGLGALSGGILTSGAWLAMGLPEKFVWAGGLIGLIGGGMISFVIFKAAVILFTTLGGSCLIAMGALAIVYHNMAGGAKVQELVFQQKWFLPLVLLAPMVVGIILQYKFSKEVKDLMV